MKQQVKGRIVMGNSNKHYALQDFFDNNNRLKCGECGCLLDPYYRSLRIDFKSKFEFSYTYEGVAIVNKRFKDFIQTEGYNNVIFFPINEKKEFYYFHVLNNYIEINKERSGIVYEDLCKTCNYPNEVIGGFEIYLQEESLLIDGFYTTDVYWRTHYSYRPWVVIGNETYKKLKMQKFKGLDMFAKVY